MSERTIAIGDIHGCATALERVLAEVSPEPDDTIVTLGDYIDRGPQSRRVIERLLQLEQQCQLVPLFGNHESMLLMALEDSTQLDFWMQCGGQQTLASYDCSLGDLPAEHLAFMRRCGLGYEIERHFFVHANYDADVSLENQSEYSLLWKHLSMQLPTPHVSGKIAVVGHTPQMNGNVLRLPHLICIDTFCFGNGCLTALDVESGEIWQADQTGDLRTG